MSTLEEFENAPVGATANGGKWVKYRPTNDHCEEWVEVLDPSNQKAEGGRRSNETMFYKGYTLDQSTAPKNAHEALELAWELAHPVKEGQVILQGTQFLRFNGSEVEVYSSVFDRTITPEGAPTVRTVEPLPDPEPEWLDAPAVLAAMDDCSWQKVWLPKPDGHWECTCCGWVRHWTKMNDVTPLYPKREEE